MKLLHWSLGIICAFCLMITFLITSVEAVTYWIPGYYEQEYTKYAVTEDVHMTMDDLLDVTHEMMSYLRGDREDLHVMTVVDGQPREFFNAREIAHMEDVRGLFIGGLHLRTGCLILAALAVILLAVTKAKLRSFLPSVLWKGSVLFFLAAAVIGGIIASDFSRCFIVFHHIFFDNDLWILDPSTDLLINIVPEPFFADTALYIGLIFGGISLIFIAACLILSRRSRKYGA